MVNIQIGIIGTKIAGWRLLLDQEGVPYSSWNNSTPDNFSVVVVADDLPEQCISQIRDYLSHGGSVLCSGSVYTKISGIACRRVFIKYLLEEKPSSLFPVELVDLDMYGYIHPDANALTLNNNQNAVYCGEYGGGYVVVLPVDAGEIILDARAAPKSFYAQRHRLPYEEVARVSKGGVRQLVSRSLEILHHRRAMPYIHKWYFPQNTPTIFGWRIDTDYANEEQIRYLFKLLHEYQIPATWFIDVKSQERYLPFYKEMTGHEIGVHCYEHRKFTDVAGNIADLQAAVTVLKKNGIPVSGYAAPFGYWNKEFTPHLQGSNIVYSSEFSYDYENVPSFPVVLDQPEQTMQVPAHPISIGNLRRQGFGEQEMVTYYTLAMERMISRHVPMILYYHPSNGFHNVVRTIFEFVKHSKLPVMKLLDYARWWQKRNEMAFACTMEHRTVNLKTSAPADDVWIHIVQSDGTECIVPFRDSIDLDAMMWQMRTMQSPIPDDIERIRKFNPWIMIQDIENNTIGKLKRR